MAERRAVPRYIFGGRAELKAPAADGVIPTTVGSISVQGCRTLGDNGPSPGEKCRVTFEWQGQRFEAEAEVAWRNGHGHAGLRFLSVTPESLSTLRELCETLQLEPLNPKARQH